MQLKIRILSVVFITLFIGLILWLFYWQVIKGKSLSQEAKLQYSSSKVTSAPRGNIKAADGSFWAVRTPAWLLYANGTEIRRREIANKLADILVEMRSMESKIAYITETMADKASVNRRFDIVEKRFDHIDARISQTLCMSGRI